jgi:hypothetical protein
VYVEFNNKAVNPRALRECLGKFGLTAATHVGVVASIALGRDARRWG